MTKAITVDILYDFGSPNAYFMHRVLPEIVARTGAVLRPIPCLLGGIFKATGNQAPILSHAKVKGKLEYDRLEIARFVRKHRLTTYRLNAHFPVNTLMMMRGAAAAELDGTHEAYLEAGMRAMWEQSLDMSDPDVFAQAFDAAGLDGARVLQRIEDAEVKAHLRANTDAAVARGAFGMPTVFVGPHMFFGKERLAQIEEQVLAAQAAS